jgi:nucleoside-diphosphate-sugar epimerase
MKILITGIGSELATALARGLAGHEVIGLARREHGCYPTLVCDLRAGVPDLPRVDVCVHLAALTDPRLCEARPKAAYRVNVAATRELARQARRFVLISTGSVYGPHDGPLREDREPAPADAYARLKHLAEKEVTDHPDAAVLRWFYPYGPGTRPTSLVTRLIRTIDEGGGVELHEGGRPRVNPIFLSDLVAATRLFCLESLRGTWNVAGPEVVSIEELARRLGAALGRPPRFAPSGRPAGDLVACTERLDRLIRPAIDLDTGLHRTVAWWRTRHGPGNPRERCA